MNSKIYSHWTFFSSIVLLLSAGWIVFTTLVMPPPTGGQTPSPRSGFLAPDFTLSTIEGSSIQLSQLTGQVVIVNLWASWCPPCKAEMPALQNAYARYHSQGLEILAVNATQQDSSTAAASFAQNEKLTFPILLDLEGTTTQKYHLQALPSTFFIDRKGIIRQVVIGGPMPEALLQTEIEQLLQGDH